MKKSELDILAKKEIREAINEVKNRTTERHIALKGEMLTLVSAEERECNIYGNTFPVKMFHFLAADNETIVSLSATKCVFLDDQVTKRVIVNSVVNKVYILRNAD